MVSFDAMGTNLWHRSSVGGSWGSIDPYNLLFDADGSIYISGKMSGMHTVSFLNFSLPEIATSGFILKLNDVADTIIWSTYHNKSSIPFGAIALNGDEIGFTSTGFGSDFMWGDMSLDVSATNQGLEVIFARFNKMNGNCIGLTKIPGNPGYDDQAAVLTVDASGDYIVGGAFGRYPCFDNGASIFNQSVSTDFFIAKYATQACTPLEVPEFEQAAVVAYPNPFNERVSLSITSTSQYQLYSITGVLLQTGTLTLEQNSIETINLAAGNYLLRLTDSQGRTSRMVLIKE